MTDIAWSVFRIVLGVYVGLSLLLYFRQSSYIYYPKRKVLMVPSDIGLHFEHVSFKARDGQMIAGWYIPGKGHESAGRALLFCHGNAGNIGDRVHSVATFHRMGLDVLIFDYRGYGTSTGTPTEDGTYLDTLAAWNYLKGDKGIPPEKIVIFGRSLGGAVATWLAVQVTPGALALESTFASAPAMAARMFPFLPVRLICRFDYDTLTRVGQVSCPVLVAHSVDDEMIPFRHAEKIFAAAPEPKRFFSMRGDHNSGGLDVDMDYQKIFREFVDTAME